MSTSKISRKEAKQLQNVILKTLRAYAHESKMRDLETRQEKTSSLHKMRDECSER